MPSPLAAVPSSAVRHLPPVEGLEVVSYDVKDEDVVPGDGRAVDLLALPAGSHPVMKRLDQVPGLKAVVLASAGYDHMLPLIPEGVQVANAVGVHDTATAELGLALLLAAQRNLPTCVRAQDEGRWEAEARPQRSLADSTVLVLGYGGVGKALARRVLACECDVIAVASTDKPGDDLVGQVHGIDRLPELLPRADILAVAVPLSDRTRGLVGAAELAALPDDALVLNVARGPVIDTDALMAECASGRLRAALDVTDPEPLPDGHPLWSTPGVLISPHVGGISPAFGPRWGAYLHRQLTAYRDSGQLLHAISRD